MGYCSGCPHCEPVESSRAGKNADANLDAVVYRQSSEPIQIGKKLTVGPAGAGPTDSPIAALAAALKANSRPRGRIFDGQGHSVQPGDRRRLVGPAMAGGSLLALAVFLPVIVWTHDHQWVSFAKQFGRVGEGAWRPTYMLEFLAAQFGLANPAILVLAALSVRSAAGSLRRGGLSPEAFLLALSGPLVLYMFVHAFHARVQPNWTMPVYPTIAILAARAAIVGAQSHHVRRLLRLGSSIGIALSCSCLAYFALPAGHRAPFSSPADRLLGWRALADDVEGIRVREGAGLVGTVDYGLTGEIAFYRQDPALVREIVERARYDFQPEPPLPAGRPMILVLPADGDRTRYRACLAGSTMLGTLVRQAGARVIERYDIVRVDRPSQSLERGGCDQVTTVGPIRSDRFAIDWKSSKTF